MRKKLLSASSSAASGGSGPTSATAPASVSADVRGAGAMSRDTSGSQEPLHATQVVGSRGEGKHPADPSEAAMTRLRSEERRVGKGCREVWRPDRVEGDRKGAAQ